MANVVPIAVIGIGCRLPGGVKGPEDLWQLLSEGRTGLSEIPPDRWNAESFYHPDPEAREALNTKKGYFLKQNVAEFDARFFGFSAAEAEQTDPQQRMVLETTYEALENAGIPLKNIKGSNTSVFVSVFARDYDRMTWKDIPHVQKHAITGNGEAILAARISYVFDLRGGAMTIDTGCSGSLVAVHQACLSLRSGESRMAIAGGTELLLHPDQFIPWSFNGMANPEGQCFAFDSRGAGYGRGEGVGTVVLKRLDHALQDGDPIHSVILNSGINQDGKTAGILLPNAAAQSALVKQVYQSAGLDPAQTLYVEAHGTGTQAGDKAEIQSIAEAICSVRKDRNLYVGSVKANVGHLEASSGIAGLIKAIMVLKKGQIPPQPNFITEKPGLNLKERGIKVPTQLTPLSPAGYTGPQRVSVSSYGYGGTNAHLVMESGDRALALNGHSTEQSYENGLVNGSTTNLENGGSLTNGYAAAAVEHHNALPFPLSAHSETALTPLAANLLHWTEASNRTYDDFKSLSYTLCCRRSFFRLRNVPVASTWEELQQALRGNLPKTRAASLANLNFVFTGQGAQWHAMGRELIATSRVFKGSLKASNDILAQLGCQWDLIEELCKSEDDSRIGQGELAQPVTTAIQIALVDLLASLGLSPSSVVGHSSGEIAAAYAAGRLEKRAAIQVAFFRGRFSAQAKTANTVQGAMLAVASGEKIVAPLLEIVAASGKGKLTIACINSPDSVTVSGDEPAVKELARMLENEIRIQVRGLKVDTAYHSHHMEKVASAYLDSLKDVEYIEKPSSSVVFYSAVTGGIKTTGFGADYWTENLVSQVRFSDALQAMASDLIKEGPTTRDQAQVVVEIGPHSALQGPIRQSLSPYPTLKYTYCPSLIRKKDAGRAIVSTAARLFELGLPVKLEALLQMQNSQTSKRCINDLPPYPWDHSRKYWRESRLSRDHRLRQFSYHDLLGLFDVMSPLNEPRWRYHIGVERLPWLNHHVVERQVIWPGTGYMCMAIEALKQLAQLRSPDSTVATLTMRNFEVAKAVIVPSEQYDGHSSEVEIQLVLSSGSNASDDPWESVRILSTLPDGTWAQNFSGLIRADSSPTSKPVDSEWVEDDTIVELAQSLEHLRRIRSLAKTAVDPQLLYETMRAAGNEFGPSFTLLTEISIGKRVGFAKMVVPDMGLYMPKAAFQPHTIHPAVLDVPNHVMGLLFYEECCKAAVMPTTTTEFKISTNIAIKAGDELLIACEITPEGKRSAKGNTWLFKQLEGGDRLALICSTNSIRLQAVGEEVSIEGEKPFSRKKNYRVAWSDQVDLLTEETFHELVSSSFHNPSHRLSIGEQLRLNDQAASIYLERAMLQPISRSETSAPHLDIFHDWITDFLGSERHQELLHGIEGEENKQRLLEKSVKSGVEGQMLARLGKHLPSILRGELHSLNVMIEDDLLNKFYMDGPLEASNVQAAEFVRLLAHNNPHMSILEIGAGTGGTTASILRSLDAYGNSLLSKYCYTDISAGFFEHAEKKFEKWRRFLDLRTLDISRDPHEQGFEDDTYDLIIASNVIHATPRIADTLAHVRKLLKPGGRFVLVEMTRPTVAEGMIFGTLSGWWASEDGRKGSPLLTREGWHDALQKASFDGIEFASYDHDGPYPRTSVIISRAIEKEPTNGVLVHPTKVVIVKPTAIKDSAELITAVVSKLQATGLPCCTEQWDSLDPAGADVEATIYLVLDDLGNPVLSSPTPAVFERIKALLTTSRNVCWVSYHESASPDITAMSGLIVGTARSVCRENEQLRLVTINVEDNLSQDAISRVADAVAKVVGTSLAADSQATRVEDTEFALRQGRLMVPRLHTDIEFNEWAESLNCDGKVEPGSFQGSGPLKLEVKIPGLLNSLCFAHDLAPTLPLAEDEIQLDTKAFGVNFRDVFIALGQMPPATPMAGEVAGIVTAIGSGDFVQSTYKVGDRVIGLLGVPYSSQTRVKGVHCQILPQSVSLTEGASIYTVFLTTYYSLIEVARLEKQQTVLIHSASGGVGQAAIQIAQLTGAEVIATVGSVEKRNLIVDAYGIPKSRILSSRQSPSSMKRKIMQLTDNRGVDVVLNSLAGEILAESWDCLAPLGVHIELGKTDIYKRNSLNMAPFDRNLTFAAVDLTVLLTQIPVKMFRLLGKILQLFDQGLLSPVKPLNILPIDQIEAAFRLIAERKHMGKVILEVPESQETQVSIALQPPSPARLAQDGTYIVAGGLGDLGRRISRLLAGFGAGHIVTLSRRVLSETDVIEFQKQIEQLGGKLHIVKCDITDKQSVVQALEYCRASLPPVRGIVHGGMVLKDRPFASMDLEDWGAALGPKVTGTINLDEAFHSPDLDYFITLSSVSGIVGRLAQANYSAGNCFQDAFVHARNGKTHTRYFTVNIGAVTGSESIASMTASTAQQELIQSASMTFTELFQVLQYAMDRSTAFEGCEQSAMGFDRQSLLSQDHFAAASPFFSMLPYTEEAGKDSSQSSSPTRDVASALRNASSIDEAVEVISQAIGEKFVAFINRDLEDISFDAPLSSFGMDSLVSIELKNWMMRTFSVTLQASELTGPASIMVLSRTLAGRSALLSPDLRAKPANGDSGEEQGIGRTDTPTAPTTSHGYECCRQFDEVPKQPIPDFDESMEDHLQNVAHFAADSDELESFRAGIKELTAPGSTGRRIYQQLARDAADPSVENWSSGHLLKSMHLDFRQGLAYSSFLLLQHDGKFPHSQAERAAIIATVAYDYKQALEKQGQVSAGKWAFGTPQCNHLQQWLFDAVREPAIGSDISRKYSSDYLVALRHGRAFRVPLTVDGGRASFDQVKGALESILEHAGQEKSWAGILTMDNRDSWAKKRQALLEVDPRNTESLRTIEAATLVINLDSGAPSNITEQLTDAMLHDGSNRWFDKPMQFVVTENGKSAVILEHSRIDGVTALSLLYELHDAINSHKPAIKNGVRAHVSQLPQEVLLFTSPDVDAHIDSLRHRYGEMLAQREFITHTTEQIGKTFLVSHSMPIKGVVEVLIQLASHAYNGGWNPESWEGVSLAHFHNGRHDMVQTVSGPVVDFCTVAADDAVPAVQRRDLMLRAASDMSATVKKAMDGKGFFRLVDVIKGLWPETEPTPAYFDHPISRRIQSYNMVVTMLDPVAPGAAAMPANPHSMRIRYAVGDNGITFAVLGPRGKGREWVRCFEEAAGTVRSLILAE